MKRTAFVCGGSSGLGLATAQLLVESGDFAKVCLTSRSAERGAAAVQRIVEATSASPDLLEALVLDCCDPASIVAVSEGLAARGARIDLLLLSAGQIYPSYGTISQGIENTLAASLAGQHALTVRLLRSGALTTNARISSRARRGPAATSRWPSPTTSEPSPRTASKVTSIGPSGPSAPARSRAGTR
jgi:NAD(P)-dependent dehydrogenase (short-subunit alcohol dehydrogenase family)